MINLLLSDIESFVRAKLDEVSPDSDFIATDNLDLAKIIEAAVVPVSRTVHLTAPNVLLDGEGLLTPPNISVSDSVASFLLPSDFMRLVSVKMSGWMKSVNTVISEDSLEYRRQQNRYLRGTMRNPVAAVLHDTNGTMRMELYISKDTPVLEQFLYVPEITVAYSNPPYIRICPKLKTACLYAITAEVLRCFDQTQKAQMFDTLAQRQLNPTHEQDRLHTATGEKVIE